MPARTFISERNRQRIKDLYERKLLFASEIGRRLGLTRVVVKRALRELGVESRGTFRPLEIGARFGRGQLTVTRYADPEIRRDGCREFRVWVHCKCEGPHSDFVVAAHKLRSGNVRSCGCLWCGSPNYRPHPDRDWGRILRTYRRNAPEFCLSIQQVKCICMMPCFYCGSPPENELMGRRHRLSTGQMVLRYSGIDEVNHGVGHIVGNLLPACAICNKAKSDETLEEWCRYTRLKRSEVLAAARRIGRKLSEIQ